jgi:hypothetical protein
VDLYIHSPLRLHGVVLNELSSWTTLLLYRYIFIASSSDSFKICSGYLDIHFSVQPYESFKIMQTFQDDVSLSNNVLIYGDAFYKTLLVEVIQ